MANGWAPAKTVREGDLYGSLKVACCRQCQKFLYVGVTLCVGCASTATLEVNQSGQTLVVAPPNLELGLPGHTRGIEAVESTAADPLDERYIQASNDGNGGAWQAMKKTFNRAVSDFIKVIIVLVFKIPIVPNDYKLTDDRLYDRDGVIVSTEKIAHYYAPYLVSVQGFNPGDGFAEYYLQDQDVSIPVPRGEGATMGPCKLIQHKFSHTQRV